MDDSSKDGRFQQRWTIKARFPEWPSLSTDVSTFLFLMRNTADVVGWTRSLFLPQTNLQYELGGNLPPSAYYAQTMALFHLLAAAVLATSCLASTPPPSARRQLQSDRCADVKPDGVVNIEDLLL